MKIAGKKKPIIQPNGTIAVIILIDRADSLEPNHTAAILAGAFAKQKAIPPNIEPSRTKYTELLIRYRSHAPIIKRVTPI